MNMTYAKLNAIQSYCNQVDLHYSSSYRNYISNQGIYAHVLCKVANERAIDMSYYVIP